MDSCQCSVSKREQFGINDGKHDLTAAMAVAQRELQQVQQTLWEGDGRKDIQIYKCKHKDTSKSLKSQRAAHTGEQVGVHLSAVGGGFGAESS